MAGFCYEGDTIRFAAFAADGVIECLQRLLAARDAHYAPVVAREFECDGAADAARCAGDEGDAFVGHKARLFRRLLGEQRKLDVLA